MPQAVQLHPMEDSKNLADLYQGAQVGRCVNSVVHDVNNYLGAIMSYAELISLDKDLGDESKRMANEIVGAVQKITKLAGTLTSIARRDFDNLHLCEPFSLVERVFDLCDYEMKVRRVSRTVTTEGRGGSIFLDETRLMLAIMQLLRCSMDRVADCERKTIAVHLSGHDDRFEIAVRDSGPAFSSQEQAVLFELSGGTLSDPHSGLGLSLAREHARFHKGDLEYDVERGLVLTLPRDNGLVP